MQDSYYNAVLAVECPLPPAALLRLAKGIERAAGRRRGRLWGPRPLDIDLIDYKGFSLGKAGRIRVPGQLILPHPELHKRTFVLAPLAEALPSWRHPRLGLSAANLVKRLPLAARGGVGSRLAFPDAVCENSNSEKRSFGA
jgi:2-amino-4-hydroxy-6-hydroxymethyldihydropteridine diphosphokinase